MRERKWSVEFTGKVLLCIIMMLLGIMFANERIYAAGTNLSNAEYFEIGSGRSGSFGNGMSKNRYKSYTLKGLKSKRRYYARVRAYKYANGRKVYSSWSIVRSVKIK